MQELIEELESIKDYKYKELTIRLVKEKLEKEKEQIISAYAFGHNVGCLYIYNEKKEFISQEEYYNQTYNK